MTGPFMQIDSKDLVDTINDGFQLLPRLEELFSDQSLVLDAVQKLQQELKDFNT